SAPDAGTRKPTPLTSNRARILNSRCLKNATTSHTPTFWRSSDIPCYLDGCPGAVSAESGLLPSALPGCYPRSRPGCCSRCCRRCHDRSDFRKCRARRRNRGHLRWGSQCGTTRLSSQRGRLLLSLATKWGKPMKQYYVAVLLACCV